METEGANCAKLDPLEEVRKLQEMVRKLELQNEELRIGHRKNGFTHDSHHQQQPKVVMKEEDITIHSSLLNIFEDLSLEDEYTWLHCSCKYSGVPINVDTWLDEELKRTAAVPSENNLSKSRDIARRLTQIKKSAEQYHIDTRTFTRPKKRLVVDPGEEQDPSSTLTLAEHNRSGSEDEHPVPNGTLSPVPKRQIVARDSSLPRYRGSSPRPGGLDATYRLERSATPEQRTELPPPPTRESGLQIPRAKGLTHRPMGRTWHLDGTQVRDPLDEDQLSSASDSSFSSSHRAALTAGEVRDLARMQEESLRYMSTPAWKSGADGRYQVQQLSSDLPSPITRSSEDLPSSEGRCSSRSSAVGDSLHSSPSGSPYGSSQALSGPARLTEGMTGSGEALDRAARGAPRVERSRGRAAQRGEAESSSGLKPRCMVRPSVQASLGAASGIPRPQAGVRSRIPAPRARPAAVSRKTQDWMDGCY